MTALAGARVEGTQREDLRGRLQSLGFDEVRFASADGQSSSLRTWLEQGYQAEMQWIDRTVEKRLAVDHVLSGVRSVILLGVNYWSDRPTALQAGHKNDSPRWARYSLHEDYHDTIKPGLVAAGHVLETFAGLTREDYRYYVDTGPVLERGWAARSGLGFRGKNAMLISRRYGNWLFLATILTRLEIAPDAPLRQKPLPPGGDEPVGLLCGKCTRCLDACPTDAFPAPGIVDSRRCISYQTIENKGIIPRELRAGIGSRVYGCDVCLEVCPWNRFAREGRQLLLAARRDIVPLTLLELLELTPEKFARIFRGTAIKRVKLVGLLRNACVVAGNSGRIELQPILLKLAGHESAVVRAHAVWALYRIAGEAAVSGLAVLRASETNEAVLAEYAAG